MMRPYSTASGINTGVTPSNRHISGNHTYPANAMTTPTSTASITIWVK